MIKKWHIKTAEGKIADFYPVFISDIQGNVECKVIKMKVDGNEYTFNYENFLMFCYFVGNEEQRRKLALIEGKAVREIPYNVTFSLSPEEKKLEIVKRRITLTIDELIASYCRNEAQKFILKQKLQHKT